MKKLLVIVAILLVAVLMSQTMPDKQAHKEAMMKAITEFVDDEAEENGFGDNLLTDLGKGVVIKAAEVALNTKLRVHNYYLFNTTYVRLKGKDQILSAGLFGQVITFGRKRNLRSRKPRRKPRNSSACKRNRRSARRSWPKNRNAARRKPKRLQSSARRKLNGWPKRRRSKPNA